MKIEETIKRDLSDSEKEALLTTWMLINETCEAAGLCATCPLASACNSGPCYVGSLLYEVLKAANVEV